MVTKHYHSTVEWSGQSTACCLTDREGTGCSRARAVTTSSGVARPFPVNSPQRRDWEEAQDYLQRRLVRGGMKWMEWHQTHGNNMFNTISFITFQPLQLAALQFNVTPVTTAADGHRSSTSIHRVGSLAEDKPWDMLLVRWQYDIQWVLLGWMCESLFFRSSWSTTHTSTFHFF